MITRFEQFLLEAISLSQAKQYTKIWKDSGMENYLNAEFKGKYRIYIPLDDIKLAKLYEPLSKKIAQILSNNGYEVVNYFDNICKKNTDNNLTKITKVLVKLKYEDLADDYNEDLQDFQLAKKQTDLTVVVSRHPIDLAGMSTGRGWNSCMNLDDGSAKSYVEQDIKNGTIIAYLITSEDTNIENPISRILIKPFIKNETTYLFPTKVHGKPNKLFYNAVETWLKDIQGEPPAGVYSINPNLHSGGDTTRDVKSENAAQTISDFIKDNNLTNFVKNVTENSFDIYNKHNSVKMPKIQNYKINSIECKSVDIEFGDLQNYPKTIKANVFIKTDSLFIDSGDVNVPFDTINGDLNLLANNTEHLITSESVITVGGNISINKYTQNSKTITALPLITNHFIDIYNSHLINTLIIPNSGFVISLTNCVIDNLFGLSDKKYDTIIFEKCEIRDVLEVSNLKNTKVKFEKCSLTDSQRSYLTQFQFVTIR